MPTLEEVIGRNVLDFRVERGLSQAELGTELARFIGGKGWTRQAVWKAERGERSFTAAELLGLIGVLGVTMYQLFQTEEPTSLPGGPIPPSATWEMFNGGRSAVDRATRTRAELRGLRQTNELLSGLVATHGVLLARLTAATEGMPEPVNDGPRGTVGDQLRTAHALAAKLAARLPEEIADPLPRIDDEFVEEETGR